MGKIKNFRVYFPSEYAKDWEWIEKNLKPGEVEEFDLYKVKVDSVPGEVQFPVELCKKIKTMELNQERIEARLIVIFGMLEQIKNLLLNMKNEQPVSLKSTGEKNRELKGSEDQKNKQLSWGKSKEEKILTFYQVLEEAEKKGLRLKTNRLKEKGGKFSTAISYAFKLFGSWDKALHSYHTNYKIKEEQEENIG